MVKKTNKKTEELEGGRLFPEIFPQKTPEQIEERKIKKEKRKRDKEFKRSTSLEQFNAWRYYTEIIDSDSLDNRKIYLLKFIPSQEAPYLTTMKIVKYYKDKNYLIQGESYGTKYGTTSATREILNTENIENFKDKINNNSNIINIKGKSKEYTFDHSPRNNSKFEIVENFDNEDINLIKNINNYNHAIKNLMNIKFQLNLLQPPPPPQPVQGGKNSQYIITKQGKRKIHVGKRGGKYYIMNKKKVYVK